MLTGRISCGSRVKMAGAVVFTASKSSQYIRNLKYAGLLARRSVLK